MVKKKDLILFALIWAGIFLVIAFIPLFFGEEFRIWAFSFSLFFILLAIIKPQILIRFYDVWLKIGNFIGNIISKVILFILFFLLFTPIAFFLKILRKDLLNKKINKKEITYWIERKNQPVSMKYQF